MTERTPPKDEALEAIDFIINVLKEHEKDLDKLVSELGTVANQMGETGELNEKVEKIENKISGLQGDVGNIIKHFTSKPQQNQSTSQTTTVLTTNPTITQLNTPITTTNPPLLVQCKNWEDFQNISTQAQNISFTISETENAFQAEALKNNQIITFNGKNPHKTQLIKTWLSKQLQIPEQKIIEGQITLA